MSSCGGNCGCGSNGKCGNGCGCKMGRDIENTTAAATLIAGVAPPANMYSEEAEKIFGEGGNGCKCGPNCKCDPCTC